MKGSRRSGPSSRAVKLTKMQLTQCAAKLDRVNTIASLRPRAHDSAGNSLRQCYAFHFNCSIVRIFSTHPRSRTIRVYPQIRHSAGQRRRDFCLFAHSKSHECIRAPGPRVSRARKGRAAPTIACVFALEILRYSESSKLQRRHSRAARGGRAGRKKSAPVRLILFEPNLRKRETLFAKCTVGNSPSVSCVFTHLYQHLLK